MVAQSFDGGKDFEINLKHVDIKTKSIPSQLLRFCLIQQRDKYAYHLRLHWKRRVFKRVVFYPEGSTRIRFDGTSFHTFAPLYEIRQEDFILLTP